MDPLLLADPPSDFGVMHPQPDDEMAFDSFCIVCDRLIVPPKPKEPEAVAKTTTKKKVCGGTIRVKNPDGTTTTRKANGQTVTRPCLKRNPQSAARLAAINATSKMQPLARAKTTDATGATTVSTDDSTPKVEAKSPPLAKIVTPVSAEPAFQSAIYCSKACMNHDAGRSSEAYSNIARTLSYDFGHHFALDTPGVLADHAHGPPSPLCISGSDTESSAASNLGQQDSGPASSAPKFMEYFRLSKQGPDHAWQEVNKQRRSSMQPAAARPTAVLPSTDSLSSLWTGDNDSAFGRSVSGSGKMRPMTPFHMSEREALGQGRRSTSISSEHSAPMATRQPLRRSELSQSSLAGSSPSADLPPEFGSAPSHTLDLFQSYANAFPVRSPSGLSTSHQRGFVFPGSTAMSPAPSEQQRRSSMSRPVTGTIRAKPKTETTWDSFGKQAVDEQNHRSLLRRTTQDAQSLEAQSVPTSRGRIEYADDTPKQSLERAVGGWKIKYFVPSPGLLERAGTVTDRSRSRSRSSRGSGSSVRDESAGRGLAIPGTAAQLSTSGSTATSRTPLTSRMAPPASIPGRHATGAMPDIAGLRLDAGTSCALEHAHACSAPRTGFNWESCEKKGMKTYELPDAPKSKLDRNKAGLFYFQ
ncbi:hypothetical protein IAU60_005010 [Kwoniella sp. DSM 27419]